MRARARASVYVRTAAIFCDLFKFRLVSGRGSCGRASLACATRETELRKKYGFTLNRID